MLRLADINNQDGIYFLWWATDHWRNTPQNWCQKMYIGSTQNIEKRLKQHQRWGGNHLVWDLWSSNEPPVVYWLPSISRQEAYLLERMIADCAVGEHDWYLSNLLGMRFYSLPRILLNNKLPAHKSGISFLDLSDLGWEALAEASRLMELLSHIPVEPYKTTQHRAQWTEQAHSLSPLAVDLGDLTYEPPIGWRKDKTFAIIGQ